MPFVREQIEIINRALEAGTLKDKRFSGARYQTNVRDIIESRKEGNIVKPAVVDEHGNAKDATPDNDFPLCIYHRVATTVYDDKVVQYGNQNLIANQVLDCSMVVYGKVPKLQLTPEMLEAVVVTGFPTIISNQIFPVGLQMMTVSVKGSTTDAQAIWSQEYKNVDFPLGQDDIYIKIFYTITSRYRKDCVAICCEQ